jgi:hypothetical protein
MPKIDAAHRILDQVRGLRQTAGQVNEQPKEQATAIKRAR